MITPRFTLTQDEIFLTLNIRAPYCNLNDLELSIDGHDFRFNCSPFYLRLNLPGKIVDNENASGEYLSEKGEFVFKYEKETKGEFFEGLELITTLLAPPKRHLQPPRIEVLSETCEADLERSLDENEWFIPQQLPTVNPIPVADIYKYGFANQKYDVLQNSQEEYYSVFETKNVENMSLTDRNNLRLDTEAMKFSSEHFLADYFDDELIKTVLFVQNPWTELNKDTISFTDSEKDTLKDLPNREYLLTKDEVNKVLCGLLDIFFAYCYDKRTTNFEGNCESGWTISRISATLSWFDAFENDKLAVVSAFRRSLIYPLYRSFELCGITLQDLRLCLNLGRVFIIKCLLDILDIFNTSSDPRYILNELYIKDYIIFMQKCPKPDLENMCTQVDELNIVQADMNLNLEEIIADAIKNCFRGEMLLDKMSKLDISNTDSESDSETGSSDDSSTDSDDSSSD